MIDKDSVTGVIIVMFLVIVLAGLFSDILKSDKRENNFRKPQKRNKLEPLDPIEEVDDISSHKDADPMDEKSGSYDPSETAGILSGKDDDPDVDEEESVYKSINGKEDHPSILLGAYSHAHRVDKIGRKKVDLLILQYSNAFFAKVNDVYHYLKASNHIEAKAQACALIEGE